MRPKLSRRALVTTALLVSAVPGQRRVLAQGSEAPPSTSDWNALPAGSTFEPIQQGTVDDLLLISAIITIARTRLEPGYQGFFSYYNDSPGLIGPRIIAGEQGTFELEPVNVSPGSSPGPTLLVRPTEQGEIANPAVLLPQSPIQVRPGDLVFFPADTSFHVSSEGTEPKSFLQLNVFPTYSQLFATEGTTVEQLAVNLGIETAYPLAPSVARLARLNLQPQTSISAPRALAGPQVFYVEQGPLYVAGQDGKVQLNRGNISNPGEIVESDVEVDLAAGDGFMIPPGGVATLQVSNAPATLLVLEIGALL